MVIFSYRCVKFSQPSVDGHLGHLYVFAIIKNAANNILPYIYLRILDFCTVWIFRSGISRFMQYLIDITKFLFQKDCTFPSQFRCTWFTYTFDDIGYHQIL